MGKSNTDFKETEGPANLHHGLAGLRGSFANLSEVRKNLGPKLSEFEESRRRAGPIGGDRRCGDSDSLAPTAGRQHAFGHRWQEKRECRQVATGTNGTDEEELRDIQRRERWPKVLEPAVDF